MVRPNQIIEREGTEFTFLMFARSEGVVERRVLLINFPGQTISRFLSGEDLGEAVVNTELITEGNVNRYAVTIDTEKLQ